MSMPVAAYVRASTAHQRASIDVQLATIAAYAASHDMTISAVYADRRRSGLDAAGRPELQRLLCDIQQGGADIHAVLVYDVSRWGRFQDSDAAAYYEFLCRRAGVAVHYVAEAFGPHPTAFEAVLKQVKRAMAAEYSRELSTKVFASQKLRALAGHKQGGQAGYALERVSCRADGSQRCRLLPGERKPVISDRITLVPGLPEQVALVQRICHLYLDGLGDQTIAKRFNAESVPGPNGNAWCLPRQADPHPAEVRRHACLESPQHQTAKPSAQSRARGMDRGRACL